MFITEVTLENVDDVCAELMTLTDVLRLHLSYNITRTFASVRVSETEEANKGTFMGIMNEESIIINRPDNGGRRVMPLFNNVTLRNLARMADRQLSMVKEFLNKYAPYNDEQRNNPSPQEELNAVEPLWHLVNELDAMIERVTKEIHYTDKYWMRSDDNENNKK